MLLDERNWNALNTIIQNSCKGMGGEWPQWSQKIRKLITNAQRQPEIPRLRYYLRSN